MVNNIPFFNKQLHFNNVFKSRLSLRSFLISIKFTINRQIFMRLYKKNIVITVELLYIRNISRITCLLVLHKYVLYTLKNIDFNKVSQPIEIPDGTYHKKIKLIIYLKLVTIIKIVYVFIVSTQLCCIGSEHVT